MYFNCQCGSLYSLLAYYSTPFGVPNSPQRIDWRCVVVEKIPYEPEKVMKVFIGKYPRWWGPYQIADLLQKVGVSENQCDKLGNWIADTQLSNFCNWVESKRKRKIQVRIDKYDTWSMDVTLSYIIIPMLKQLKETKHSAADVDDKDVPKKLRSTSSPKK